MTEPEHPSFRQRRLEADEAVRRKNLEERGVSNVVPLKLVPAPPPSRMSPRREVPLFGLELAEAR